MKTTMKWIGVILGVLMVILGLYGVCRPGMVFTSLGWLIGLSVLCSGFEGIGAWWAGRKSQTASTWDLVMAILSIVFGIMLISNIWMRMMTDEFLLVLFGVWVALSGILRIFDAIRNKPKLWGLLVAIGVALIVLGVLSLAHPLITALTIGLCVAMNIVCQGISLICAACVFGSNGAGE